jgi:archaemetzincin
MTVMKNSRLILRIVVYSLLGITAWTLTHGDDKFKMPTAAERVKALGSTEKLPAVFRKAVLGFDDFERLPAPGSSDWLAQHKERGQSFDKFVKSKPNVPDKKRNKLYFQPIGDFPEGRSPSLKALKECATLTFGLPVVFMKPIALSELKVKTRINGGSGQKQVRTVEVMNHLAKKLPDDAYCCLGITMTDLYPGRQWNFVFGVASLFRRVGVYSFARYDPAFYGGERDKKTKALILLRSCKVLIHETGHMFGLEHCIYFNCVEAGANHLEESDGQPMHFCPICLRKLYHVSPFDVVKRYKKLQGFYKSNGLLAEARWIEERLKGLKP